MMEKRVGPELEGDTLRVVNDHWHYVVLSSMFALRNRVRARPISFWHIKEKTNG